MSKYTKLTCLSTNQLLNFKGNSGQILRNSDTGEFVYFNGIQAGGYSFDNVESLERFMETGVPPESYFSTAVADESFTTEGVKQFENVEVEKLI